jgi:DNA repair exonuclease SbcCD nuclease subunit
VLSDTLAALADAGAEVIVTSGNHDPLRGSGSRRRSCAKASTC